MQAIIPYRTDGGIAKLSCNGVSLTRDGKWVLPIWREIGGGAPCQQVGKSTKALHGVASVLLSGDQVRPPASQRAWQERFMLQTIAIDSMCGRRAGICTGVAPNTALYRPASAPLIPSEPVPSAVTLRSCWCPDTCRCVMCLLESLKGCSRARVGFDVLRARCLASWPTSWQSAFLRATRAKKPRNCAGHWQFLCVGEAQKAVAHSRIPVTEHCCPLLCRAPTSQRRGCPRQIRRG